MSPFKMPPRAGKVGKGAYPPGAGFGEPEGGEALKKLPMTRPIYFAATGRVPFPKAGKDEAKPSRPSVVRRIRTAEQKEVPPGESEGRALRGRGPSASRTGRSSRRRRPSVPTCGRYHSLR
ncbi:unnamed protein product [Ixodes pacificus]